MKKRRKAVDPDNPPLTAADFKAMRPVAETHPGIVMAAKRGRPRLDAPKQLVTLRLDADLLAHFKRRGDGWRTAINDALRAAVRLKKSA